LRAEIYTAHSSKLAGAFVKTILPLRHRCGRCGSAYQGDGPQAFLLFLIMRCPPSVRLLIVLTLPPSYRCPLSTDYRPLGSCSRAAGWSAATSCIRPKRTPPGTHETSVVGDKRTSLRPLRKVQAHARSSLSAPHATMVSAPSGRGRCMP
jgi:hypothetical protein